MKYQNNIDLRKLAVALGVSFAAGAIGSLATFPNISTWYASLAKPPFSPPNWVFGPVWTLLYILMGVGLYLVWTARTKRNKRLTITLFGVQLVLNVLWSLVFFGLHGPLGGLVVIVLLWAMIIATMMAFWRLSKLASYCLVPYVAWVSFATLLNLAIVILN